MLSCCRIREVAPRARRPALCVAGPFFFFNDTATTEIYTLSLHDALPIFAVGLAVAAALSALCYLRFGFRYAADRKSTRLNSSHANISYAVFCLKKKDDTTLYHDGVIAAHSEWASSVHTFERLLESIVFFN